MYQKVKDRALKQYGSINRLALRIGVNSADLYTAFNGTKPMYPKYKKLIAEALGEDAATLFEEVQS